ncbi:polysaccharide pyruvyl transferase family protein [Jejuia pallidilutea]|uniref:Gll1779 protein n=1 Tax=Jejuia pallidilutea TaxID=504487 RepID=A0A090VS16_9FLAO|nr:polysaccharide pyruvyl transferase family protein [Jejuia pallidilutea]GAL67510.1 Gll1779 protein [Jejuia pallidilutea]GAL71310.1 Gll1779 protein [Jejuia pallidilutea]GAL88716.1 Gll1779 protein [Jejuia pallidilutea]
MKIGILTFHTPINYGAALQAFALQKHLRDEYPELSIQNIDFKTDVHISKYNIFIPLRRNILVYLYKQFFIVLRYPSLRKRKKRFKSFIEEELKLTDRYSSVDDLLQNPPIMDHYIVGSDQVFHPRSEYLEAYYLNFPKNNSKKSAYAPSFGISEFDKVPNDKIKPLLEDFDNICCRESDGAKYMSNLLNKDVPVVLDPIFLLSDQQWEEMSCGPLVSEKYIFIYDLNGGYDLLKIANKISKETGLKIVCQTQSADHFYKNCTQVFDSGPREFISLIKNAEYVVTDSFHGTAFSILFNKKQFIYVARPHASGRIRSIMGLCDISERIIENGKANNFNYLDNKNLNTSNRDNLNKLIESSKAYLRDAIN